MAKKRWLRFDAAGWFFWGVVFLVVLGPCLYGAWHLVYAEASPLAPLALGFVLAAVAAGLVSWGVNAVLQRRVKKQRQAKRKEAKKRK